MWLSTTELSLVLSAVDCAATMEMVMESMERSVRSFMAIEEEIQALMDLASWVGKIVEW